MDSITQPFPYDETIEQIWAERDVKQARLDALLADVRSLEFDIAQMGRRVAGLRRSQREEARLAREEAEAKARRRKPSRR